MPRMSPVREVMKSLCRGGDPGQSLPVSAHGGSANTSLTWGQRHSKKTQFLLDRLKEWGWQDEGEMSLSSGVL